jgi:hypothetical protein
MWDEDRAARLELPRVEGRVHSSEDAVGCDVPSSVLLSSAEGSLDGTVVGLDTRVCSNPLIDHDANFVDDEHSALTSWRELRLSGKVHSSFSQTPVKAAG